MLGRAERAGFGEGIEPEMLGADAPAAAAGPCWRDFDGCGLRGEGGEDEGALHLVVGGERGVGHEEAVQ